MRWLERYVTEELQARTSLGRVHTPLEPLVLAATLALIPVLIIEFDAPAAGDVRHRRELGHLGRFRIQAGRDSGGGRAQAGRTSSALARRGDRGAHDAEAVV
jgi:hypothetical protein